MLKTNHYFGQKPRNQLLMFYKERSPAIFVKFVVKVVLTVYIQLQLNSC